MSRMTVSGVVVSLLAGLTSSAIAQEATVTATPTEEIAVPTLIMEGGEQAAVEEEVDRTQVVVSAGKRVESIQETSSIVTVVTREQIDRRGYQTVEDVLRDVPGFESMRPRAYWRRHYSMARGNARTILYLWNGVPLNGAESNQFPSGHDGIPLSGVDRIEILSGPGGVLWGANAFLGIVNVIPYSADSARSRAEATLGTGSGKGQQDAYLASVSGSDTFLDGKLSVYANATYYTSKDARQDLVWEERFGPFASPAADGTFVFQEPSGPTKNTRDRWLTLSSAINYENFRLDVLYPVISQSWMELQPRGIRTEQSYDPTTDMVQYEGASREMATTTLWSLRHTLQLGKRASLTNRVYYTGFMENNPKFYQTPPGFLAEASVTRAHYPGMTNFLKDGGYRGGYAADVSAWFGKHNALGGVETFVEGVRGQILYGTGSVNRAPYWFENPGKRYVFAGFINDRWHLTDRVRVEAGVRVQYADSYGVQPLASASALWNPVGKLYLKMNAAQGFRPPALLETNRTNNAYELSRKGVPDLKPEQSSAVEFEASTLTFQNVGQLRYASLRAGYQLSRLTNLVLLVDAAPANVGERIIHSAEARADFAFKRGSRVYGIYHFIYGTDSVVGPLRNIANHKVGLGTELALGKELYATLGIEVLGPREDYNRVASLQNDNVSYFAPASAITVDHLPSTGLIRAGIRRTNIYKHFDLGLTVDNLLNASYYIPDEDFDKRETPFPMDAPGLYALLTLTGRLQ